MLHLLQSVDMLLTWTTGLQVLAEWCKQTDALLAESEAGTATPLNDESGPDTELEFWRVRMAKFNSVTEQMKSKECRLVMGVCSTARSKQYKHWKEVDVKACIIHLKRLNMGVYALHLLHCSS